MRGVGRYRRYAARGRSPGRFPQGVRTLACQGTVGSPGGRSPDGRVGRRAISLSVDREVGAGGQCCLCEMGGSPQRLHPPVVSRSSRPALVGPSPRRSLSRVRHRGGGWATVGAGVDGHLVTCRLGRPATGQERTAAPRQAAAGRPIGVRRSHALRRGGVRSHAAVVRPVGWRGGEDQRRRSRCVHPETMRRRCGRATVGGGVAGARVDRAIAGEAALMAAPRRQTNSPGCSGPRRARHGLSNTPATIRVPRRAQRPAGAAGSALVPACSHGVVRHVDTPPRRGRPRVDLRADIAATSDSRPRACCPIRRGPCCPAPNGRNRWSSARTSSSRGDVGRFGCASAFRLLAPRFVPAARVRRAKVDPQQATTRGSTFARRRGRTRFSLGSSRAALG